MTVPIAFHILCDIEIQGEFNLVSKLSQGHVARKCISVFLPLQGRPGGSVLQTPYLVIISHKQRVDLLGIPEGTHKASDLLE